jgi:CRISPR-associated protein Csd1
MLLTRLAEHAARSDELPPSFYRNRAVRWAIEIQADGTPAALRLTGRADKQHPAGYPMAAPYIYRSGQRPPAVLLVDDLRYVAGWEEDDSERARADAARRNQDYITLLERWRASTPQDPVPQAVVSFFKRGFHKKLNLDGAKPRDVTAIWVEGHGWAHDRDSAVAFWGTIARERKTSAANTGICLVCGRPGPLLDTIPEAVKSGAIPAGKGRGRDAQLVSVNKPAQGRGGKIQLASAPVCDQCGSAAMSALNSLLADDRSRHRTPDSVLTWWLRKPQEFPWIDWLNNPQPGHVRDLIREIYAPHRTPATGGVEENDFYAVTLSVNQSRAVVRDWLDVPLGEIRHRLGSWFADHQVTDLWQDGLQAAGLWRLAISTGRWGTENGKGRYLDVSMPHGCERDLLLIALRGTPPPSYLLPHLLQRIRADGRIDLPRAALLRLILVRSAKPPKENYMTGLDPDLPSPAYQCGRTFAVMEQIQRAALGKDLNTTIADKYLPAATATPLPILTMLQKNTTGHMKRLRRSRPGAHSALASRLDEVLAHISGEAGIPATLTLPEQAKFILGYHHQRAADFAAARARGENKNGTTDPGDTQ